jgi:hypothetical protein
MRVVSAALKVGAECVAATQARLGRVRVVVPSALSVGRRRRRLFKRRRSWFGRPPFAGYNVLVHKGIMASRQALWRRCVASRAGSRKFDTRFGSAEVTDVNNSLSRLSLPTRDKVWSRRRHCPTFSLLGRSRLRRKLRVGAWRLVNRGLRLSHAGDVVRPRGPKPPRTPVSPKRRGGISRVHLNNLSYRGFNRVAPPYLKRRGYVATTRQLTVSSRNIPFWANTYSR